MARVIHPDGTEETLRAGGKKWTPQELQAIVGGPIEVVPGTDWGMSGVPKMLVHEEGRILGLPTNRPATRLLHQYMAKKLHIAVEDLPLEVGKRLRYLPKIVGTVVVLERGEKM